MFKYIKTNKTITCYINGKPLMCSNTHANWNLIKNLLDNNEKDQIDLNYLESLFKVENIILKSNKNIKIYKNTILYKGKEIHNVLVDKILGMIKENINVNYMIKFLDNLMENPSERARNELYGFLEVGKLPLSNDGCFYAYKKVRKDYKDIYSGTMDNSVGKILKMKRDLVDDNKDRTCSSGLHFCSYSYLNQFGSNSLEDFNIVIVKINPKNVVSIPADYSNTKGRCCEYKVVQDITKEYVTLKQKDLLEKSEVYFTGKEKDILSYFGFLND